ncbi:hypothetical protein ACLHY9_24120, partial [Escherichia coli]|uniref:hypothetical protein n=3 Tax=Escherichia coli TaxID=562 RepID=UPI0039A60CBE
VRGRWICPYISRYLLSLNPLPACCRRYSHGKLYPEEFKVEAVKQVVERGVQLEQQSTIAIIISIFCFTLF